MKKGSKQQPRTQVWVHGVGSWKTAGTNYGIDRFCLYLGVRYKARSIAGKNSKLTQE